MKINIAALETTVKVGKTGITGSLIKEIKLQLNKRKLIKIKLTKGALEAKNKKELAKELAEKTNSELVKAVGFVVILKKKI